MFYCIGDVKHGLLYDGEEGEFKDLDPQIVELFAPFFFSLSM